MALINHLEAVPERVRRVMHHGPTQRFFMCWVVTAVDHMVSCTLGVLSDVALWSLFIFSKSSKDLMHV